MPLHLIKTYPRLWSLDAGVAMVVTDLHGDWDSYARYRDRFVDLRAARQVDCLIFTGDLIHREPGEGIDRSLDIVVDLLALRERYGDAVIYLCGNHELPHLYGFVLSKAGTEYTPAFESALSRSGQRAAVLALFDSLPLFIRTAAGICVTHAGAAAELGNRSAAVKLFTWDHQALRAWTDERLAHEDLAALRSGYARMSGESSYDVLARHYLATVDSTDPRYDDLLRGFLITAHPDFSILRAALFTRCEQEYGEMAYAAHLAAVLERLSVDYTPQHTLVAGHMATRGGYTIVAERHLRLASAAHARPRQAGQYLLFDSARSTDRIEDVCLGLQSIY